MGGIQVRRSKNPRQGESLDKTMTKQTVQLRARQIQKTRRQAGGFWDERHYTFVLTPWTDWPIATKSDWASQATWLGTAGVTGAFDLDEDQCVRWNRLTKYT